MGYIQGADRNQVVLLPETLDDYVGMENEMRVIDLIIPRKKSNRSAIQIHFSAYQSSLHLSRTSDLRSCLTASLTNEAGSELQQSRGCKATSVSSPDSFCGKVDSMARNSGSEQTDCRGFQCGIIIDSFIDGLDIKTMGFKAEAAREGRPGYDPRDMLKLYMYGYSNHIRSSRRLQKEAARNVGVMWLLKKIVPDFRCIADFRKDNAKAIKEVFRAFVKLCNGAGLLSHGCY